MRAGQVQRRLIAAGVGIAAGVMSVAGLAWACTQQAYFQSVRPGAAPSGSEVTLTSQQGFESGPVEIRWNHSDGQVLATAMGPSFSARITIPEAHPDIYYIVGVQRAGDVITNKAVVSFEVTPAGSSTSGPARSGAGTTEAAERGSTSSQTTGGSGTISGVAEEQARPSSPASGPAFPAEAGANGNPNATASHSPAAGTTQTAASSPRSVAENAQAVSPAARPATSAGTAGAGVTAPADDRERAPGGAEAAASPSVDSVSGDLWGGFSAGAADRASLAPDQPVHSSGTSPVAAGAAVMSGGS